MIHTEVMTTSFVDQQISKSGSTAPHISSATFEGFLNPTQSRMSHIQFQGDLDGLCGMYSVYNAVRTLFGKDLATGALDEIIKRAMNQFDADAFRSFFYDGMCEMTLERLLNDVKKLLSKNHGLNMAMKKVQYMRCDAMLKNMTELQESVDCVFIIGISGRIEHWTCVEKASSTCMTLLDSGGLKQLRQTSFKVSDDEAAGNLYKVGSKFWVLARV